MPVNQHACSLLRIITKKLIALNFDPIRLLNLFLGLTAIEFSSIKQLNTSL